MPSTFLRITAQIAYQLSHTSALNESTQKRSILSCAKQIESMLQLGCCFNAVAGNWNSIGISTNKTKLAEHKKIHLDKEWQEGGHCVRSATWRLANKKRQPNAWLGFGFASMRGSGLGKGEKRIKMQCVGTQRDCDNLQKWLVER